MLPMGSVCIAAVYPGALEIFLDQKVEGLRNLRKKNDGTIGMDLRRAGKHFTHNFRGLIAFHSMGYCHN
jgi:hypothetical protein